MSTTSFRPIFLLLFVFYAGSSLAMESAESNDYPVTILDLDTQEMPTIENQTIFGATPRVSQFNRFVTTTVHDIEELLKSKPKGLRKDLKGLKAREQSSLIALKDELTNNKHRDIAQKCFFEHGFDTTLFEKNIETLLKGAFQTTPTSFLHTFLPIYFEKNDFQGFSETEKRAFIKEFLLHSAHFYKKLYEKKKQPNDLIYVVIPSTETFCTEIEDPADTIATLLDETFLKAPDHTTLLNQNKTQLTEIANKLALKGYTPDTITLRSFTIYAGAKPTTLFTPYRVPSEKVPDFKTSCVLSPELVETFKRAQNESNNDE